MTQRASTRGRKIASAKQTSSTPQKPMNVSVEIAPIHVTLGGRTFDLTEEEARNLLYGLNRVLRAVPTTTSV